MEFPMRLGIPAAMKICSFSEEHLRKSPQTAHPQELINIIRSYFTQGYCCANCTTGMENLTGNKNEPNCKAALVFIACFFWTISVVRTSCAGVSRAGRRAEQAR